MRIAQVAPLYEAVPPLLYGGTERVVSWLTEELVAMGHEVTLFASGDSVTRAELDAICPRALRLDPDLVDGGAPTALLFERVARRAGEFDVIHSHMDYLPLSLFSRLGVPLVTTMHGRLNIPEQARIFEAFPDATVVTISDDQRRPRPGHRFARTIHHGLPVDLLRPTGDGSDGYLAFLGRISPEKGPDAAIRIARAARLPLHMAAKVDRVDREYHETVVSPLISGGPGVDWVGEIGDDRKAAFLSGARALLMPIAWPEPFGLVMIEAMACGTPVVAFRRGSVPEIVEHGVTGFVVDTEAEAVAAVKRLGELDRSVIRARFEERFSSRRMATDYVTLYRDVVASGGG